MNENSEESPQGESGNQFQIPQESAESWPPPNTGESQSSNRGNIFRLIVIIAVVVILIAGGAYYVIVKFGPSAAQPTESSQISSTSPEPTLSPTSLNSNQAGLPTPRPSIIHNSSASTLQPSPTSQDIVVTPASGAVFPPGATVHFIVNYSGHSSGITINISFNGGQESGINSKTLEYDYKSVNSFPGRKAWTVLVSDSAGNFKIVKGYIDFIPQGAPTKISASPSTIELGLTNSTTTTSEESIDVEGTYPGYSQTLDIGGGDSAILGTTYRTLSGNNNIIKVSLDGKVTAVSPGEDAVVVTNHDQPSIVDVIVDSN